MRLQPRRLLSALAGAVLAGFALSGTDRAPAPAEPAAKKAPDFALVPCPDDAVAMALPDARTLPPDAAYYTRFIWNTDEDERSLKSDSLALNYVSRSSTIQRPFPVGTLARVDLRQYFPRENDLREALKLWEEFAFDPAFSLLLTKDTVGFIEEFERLFGHGETRTVYHPGGDYHYPDGSGRVSHNVPAGNYTVELRHKAVDVIRLDPGHLDPARFSELRLLLGTDAPVVSDRYFKFRALSTVQDKAVFKTVFGGLYYQLVGINRSKDKRVTDQDLFFRNLGVGSLGENARRLFDRVRSDQRAALLRSEVTGKPRVVFMLPTLSNRDGQSWGAITEDVGDDQIDLGDVGYANLLDPHGKAREALFPKANGLIEGALFNDADALQDEVPPDVAAARNRPVPHTTRLQPLRDCLDCHYAAGHDGWIPAPNDVKAILAGWKGRRLDIFGDLSAKRDAFSFDTFDRLAGLYAGDFSKFVRRSRDDAAEVTLKATGPWEESPDQTDIAKVAHSRLKEEIDGWFYGKVAAEQALREWGFRVPPGRAVEILNRLLPPDGRSEVAVPYVGRVIPEDPRLASLKAGLGIGRPDFSLAYSFGCERARRQAAANVAAGLTWWGDKP
jgi:hypothetical protein